MSRSKFSPWTTYFLISILSLACKASPSVSPRPLSKKSAGSSDSVTRGGVTRGSETPVPKDSGSLGPKPSDTKNPESSSPGSKDPPGSDPGEVETVVEPCESVDLKKVKKVEDFLCLGSREKIIAGLPDPLKAYVAFMRKSRSAQTATLQTPRAMIISPDGSFMFTFATDPKASKDLEVVVYDYEKNVWDFGGIDFTQNPPKVERDLCKSCHGAEWHPIWPNYPHWPGAIVENHLEIKADEAEVLSRMARKEIDHPLLKLLKLKESYKVSDRVRDAATGLREDDVNMMVNISAATKSARKLAGKIIKDTKLSRADRLAIIREVNCDVDRQPFQSATLKRVGYKIEDHFFHGILGIDKNESRYNDPDSGKAYDSPSFFLGMILLKDAMDKDAAFADKLPGLKSFFKDPKFTVVMGENVSDFLKAARDSRVSWSDFRAHYHEGFRLKTRPAQKQVTSECAIIKAYQ